MPSAGTCTDALMTSSTLRGGLAGGAFAVCAPNATRVRHTALNQTRTRLALPLGRRIVDVLYKSFPLVEAYSGRHEPASARHVPPQRTFVASLNQRDPIQLAAILVSSNSSSRPAFPSPR